MTFRAPHEMHRKRLSRNVGLALALAAFVALVFALTIVKVQEAPHQNDASTVQGG